MDDMLDILDQEVPKKPEPKPSSAPTSEYSNNSNRGGFDPWNDEITPREIDTALLKRFDRTFTITSSGEVPQTVIDNVIAVLDTINSVHFTLRDSLDSRDALLVGTSKHVTRRDYILPWKKFNTSVDAKVSKPSKYAYEVAAYFHKAFKKIPNVVKTMIARNNHLILGAECDTPVNFIICYSDDGADTKKKVDYKTTGNISYFIEVGEELNIPIFNFKNEGAKEKLLGFLETFKN